jgi:hypothetical protein
MKTPYYFKTVAATFSATLLSSAITEGAISFHPTAPGFGGISANDQLVSGGNQSTNISFNGVSLPHVITPTATGGDASSTATIDLSQSAFKMDYDFQSAGNPSGGDGSNGISMQIRFSVDVVTSYNMIGAFGTLETAGSGNGSMFARLQNLTEGGDLFNVDRQSNFAEGEGFALDIDSSQPGNNVDNLTGSLTGALEPGKDYRISFSSGSGMSHTPSTGIGRAGMMSIEFSAVPEPSSTALLGLGGLALMLRRRR